MLKNRFGEFHLRAHNVFDCFVEQWLENEEIAIVLWSCYHRRHRTNNAVEGWNNKVNSYFERPHQNIKKVLGCLQKEAENCNHLYMIMILNLEGKKRKKCSINPTQPNLSAKTFTASGTSLILRTYSYCPQIGRFFPQMRLPVNGIDRKWDCPKVGLPENGTDRKWDCPKVGLTANGTARK
jgi:hypothetical protein